MTSQMELADRVLDMVGQRASAEVRVVGGVSALTRFANSFIHQNVAEEGALVLLRVAAGGRVASASTTATASATADVLRRWVEATLEGALLQPPDSDWPGLAEPFPAPDINHYDPATARASPAERAQAVRAFVESGPGMRAAGYCETLDQQIAFANSAGQHVEGRATRAVIDGIHQTETSAGSGHAASARLADLNPGAVGELAARRALDSIEAVDVEPGEYQVVLAPECVATIAIFLAFYGFNAKMHQEGMSFARVGVGQFDPAFRLWDDATDPRAVGVGFDEEGTPKRRLELVTGGVTAGLAHDRRTAHKAGRASTGHALTVSGARYGPIPTNLFVGGRETPAEELVGAVERGIYVSTFNYCRVLDPKTLVVTGLTRNGTFLIEGGMPAGAVSNLRFTQSFVAGLGPGRLLGVGGDARLADSEFGPGLAHVPSLRLAGWQFTGGAAG
ncbi:MAG: TldD/PmbA family protein [Acidimicrobiia bacterium]